MQTNVNHCIYINYQINMMIGVWVDDLIIIGSGLNNIKKLKTQLNQAFEIKDLGELTYFLRIQVTRNQTFKTLHLNQTRYIIKALERFQLEECKTTSTSNGHWHQTYQG